MAMPGGYTPQQSYGPTNQQQPQGITFGEPAPGSTGAGSFGQQPQQPQIDQPQQQQPQQQLSREDYRDKWMSSGTKDQAGLTNFLNQYGGTQLSGNGTVKTPYGDDVIDMLIGARSGGNGMPGWTGLPGMSQSQVTPWNGQQQQSGGGTFPGQGGPQANNWLMQLLQQMQGGGYSGGMQQPRQQDMEYNRNAGNGGPVSNYFAGGGQMGQQPWANFSGGTANPYAGQATTSQGMPYGMG